MTNCLMIVESPSKAKTLKKYLSDKNIEVLASYGHVRDLVPKQGAVDPNNHFAMKYQRIEKNKKHLDEIIEQAKHANQILLATDPDREGEAIAWHLLEALHEENLTENKTIRRVVFHEITPTAVKHAVETPRNIEMSLVNAQQARRALDYLVGFNLSPLLWKKIRRGLSAGRVQSPALRLIVERDLEIAKFVSQEYWSIHLEALKKDALIEANLVQFQKDKIKQLDIKNEEQSTSIIDALMNTANGKAFVSKVEKKARKKSPPAPFTTSTLQQEGVRKLHFGTGQIMKIAQQLYEGIKSDDGLTGLITYMRTDAVHLSEDAIKDIRGYIESSFDSSYLPKTARTYKTRVKNAQEAHEAIRPTAMSRTPESLKKYLNREQFKVYEMIWKRTLACQMTDAQLEATSVDIDIKASQTDSAIGIFRATGQVIKFDGFMVVYQESVDPDAQQNKNNENSEATEPTDTNSKFLPPLSEGDILDLQRIFGLQHFTQPPARYNEASLVKSLEEYGIGRPSTYATIISTLIAREYVVVEKRRLISTDVGQVVNGFLTKHFTNYVDYNFTAGMENQLDSIANNEAEWIPVLNQFWQGFNQLVQEKQSIPREEVTQEKIDEHCPKCNSQLSIRLGKNGKFIGCTAYPECDYTRPVHQESAESQEEHEQHIIEDHKCPKCESDLVIRKGKYGNFIGCTNYPTCKYIEPIDKPKDSGVVCPSCGEGHLVQKKSRFGTFFYSCNNYPSCKFAISHQPIAEHCPQCDSKIMMLKVSKRRGVLKVCPDKACKYEVVIEMNDANSPTIHNESNQSDQDSK